MKWMHTTHFPAIAALVLWFIPIAHQRPTLLWQTAQVAGTIRARVLNESSGLAIAPQMPEVLWSHNDSGDAPRLYAISRAGELLAQVDLAGVPAYDIEDIAAGPCRPHDTRWCLFVADIGDNRHKRAYTRVYRFGVPDTLRRGRLDVEHVEYVRYPEGPHDAEALVVHPLTGQRWIIQKSKSGRSNVFVLPEGNSNAKSPKLMRLEARIDLQADPGVGRLVTGADMSSDGRCLMVRTYTAVHTYCAHASTHPSAYAAAKVDILVTPSMFQSEAVAFDPVRKGLWISSERWPAPLLYIPPRVRPR